MGGPRALLETQRQAVSPDGGKYLGRGHVHCPYQRQPRPGCFAPCEQGTSLARGGLSCSPRLHALHQLPPSSHRITERSGLEGTSVGHPVQPPCPSMVTHSRLHRTLSRRVLNISREGESTASLGSLGQGSITLRVKKFFLMFRWSFLCFSLCLLPLVVLLGTTGKSLAPSS